MTERAGAAPGVDARRINGDRVEIDYDATLDFFETRAARAARPDALTTVLYQDAHPEVAAARHAFETTHVLPHLGLAARPRVLDVGCGNGRWARTLQGQVRTYLGIDFSPGLVEQARASLAAAGATGSGFRFQVLSAVDLAPTTLTVAPPFDLVVLAGVLLYLNDDDVDRVVAAVAQVVASEAVVYVREPVAIHDRLTLDRFPSSELAADYTAVYRPAAHYRARLAEELGARGFRFEVDEPISAELTNRAETTQHYFVLRRS
jgi:SAM-dependent methyltransferase